MISDALFSGLKTAQTQVVQSVERIVSQTAKEVDFKQTLEKQSVSSGEPVHSANMTETVMPVDMLVSDVVSMNVASAAYRANIATIKAWDDMTKNALSVKPTDEKV